MFPRDKVEGNIRTRGKTKLTSFPRDHTFEFDQGHMTKNQPITVLILLSESLAI